MRVETRHEFGIFDNGLLYAKFHWHSMYIAFRSTWVIHLKARKMRIAFSSIRVTRFKENKI